MKESREMRTKLLSDWVTKITEKEQEELINKYHSDEPIDPVVGSNQKVMIGTWLNRGAKAMCRNATEEEIHRVMRVVTVIIMAPKHNLDVSKAIKDEKMDDIMAKYIIPSLIEERMLEMHKKGFANQRISEILGIPESTVRFFVEYRNVPATES